jgi:hypothetical protein
MKIQKKKARASASVAIPPKWLHSQYLEVTIEDDSGLAIEFIHVKSNPVVAYAGRKRIINSAVN